jgi:hypothetical protein
MNYARLNEQGEVELVIDLTAEQYAAMQANGKAARLRIWLVDSKPTPAAGQIVFDAGIAVGAVEAHQTWGLRQMTADELEAEAVAAAKAGYQAHIDALNLQLDITNAMRGAMTTNQRLNTLEADTRATMRAVKDLLRQAKRSF